MSYVAFSSRETHAPVGLLLVATLCCCLAGHTVEAQPVVTYPNDMRVVDLTQPPYNADPTGRTDATIALQKALDDHHMGDNWILYLPDGTYLLSDTLDWGNGSRMGPVLQGQSRDGTILKLKDKAGGFDDPMGPKPVMTIANRGSADAFCMAVRNLTINTGKQNPGATGLQFMANNQGAVRDVLIVSEDGTGVIGLDMAFVDMIGPLLVKNVEIRGFDVGIATANAVASMTFEHLRLSGQKVVGFRNAGQCVSIRGLVSENAVTAIENLGTQSLMVLIDSQLTATGDPTDVPAISNTGHCYLRNIDTPRYAHPLKTTLGQYAGADPNRINEFVSGQVLSLFPSLHHSLNLPVRETPVVPWGNPAKWANVEAFGADTRDATDDTEAIQRAIDSGAETIYFPHPLPAGKEKTNLPRGSYRINGTIHIRGNVRRLIGGGGHWKMIVIGGETRDGAFVIDDGESPEVIFEDFNIIDSVKAGELCPLIQHRSKRTLVLRHINSIAHNTFYQGQAQAGNVFIEDLAAQFPMNGKNRAGDSPGFYFAPGQKAWARQLNPETNATKIVNDGAELWVLGLKTEVKSTVVENRNGGRTEILGGLNYPSLPSGDGEPPMFRLLDGPFTAIMGEAGFNRRFAVLVEEHRDGQVKTLAREQAPSRSGGSMLPLYTANWQPAEVTPPPPSDLQITAADPRTTQLSWQGPGADNASLGEYIVYRDGVEIGRTRQTMFLDRGLQDATGYTYRIEELNLAAQSVAEVESRITTPVDSTPPSVVRASYQKYPPTLVLDFSEALDASTITNPEMFKVTPMRQINSITLGASDHQLQLHLDDQESLPDEVAVRGVRDRAKQANTLDPVNLAVDIPVQPQPLLNAKYSEMKPGEKTPGVTDDSAWKKAKAEISVVADGDKGPALQVGVHQFAQVILGLVPVQRGRSYRVVAHMRTSNPDQKVRLELRQKEKPFTSHGSVVQPVGVSPTPVQFEFRADSSDTSARLYLITSGETTLWLERVLVLEMPTAAQLAAPTDKSPPKLVWAKSMKYPTRIDLLFSETVDGASASTPANYTLSPEVKIVDIERKDDLERVSLLLAPNQETPAKLTVSRIIDRAPRPNILNQQTIEITPGPDPRVLYQDSFDKVKKGSLPSGIRDDSAWKKTKAELRVHDDDDNGWLEIGSAGFAQIDMQRISIKQGARYRVLGRLSSLGEPRKVNVMMRQFNSPFKVYGSANVETADKDASRVLLEFVADANDGNAHLYMIIQGDASLRLDELIVVEESAPR